MKMRKELAVVIGCVTLLGIGITGCGNSAAPKKSNSESQTKHEAEEKTIKIEDLEWSVNEGVIDGERYVLLELANNSSYAISNFEITFKEKDSLLQEEKEQLYVDLQTKFELSDEDITSLREKEISMYAKSEKIIEPGEKITNTKCYYYAGFVYLKNMEHYNLVEPDIATIKYIGSDQIYTVYYDFVSKKYSTEERAEEAYQWTITELGEKVPKPNVKVLEAGRDDEKVFMFTAYGLKLEQFNDYVEECKEVGYTVDANSYEGFYSADNSEGYNVYLHYDEEEESMSGTIKSNEG